MKRSILFALLCCSVTAGYSQTKYFSDIIITEHDKKYADGYTSLFLRYWRFDTCLYSKNMCRYSSSTGASVKVTTEDDYINYEILRGNNSGYQSKHPSDTFTYFFTLSADNPSKLIRKILLRDSFVRIDTSYLMIIDTLQYRNERIIRKVFGDSGIPKSEGLNIYVLKTINNDGKLILHYWVERIGIIKIVEEECWRYSFELYEGRNKFMEKFFSQIFAIIKSKYKDPYWLSEPCSFE